MQVLANDRVIFLLKTSVEFFDGFFDVGHGAFIDAFVVVADFFIQTVDTHEADLIELSDQIWAWAETALAENNSAKALADYAETQGFTVERGVAEMPTAFIASYGSGEPIIGILGEFDALPGISQKASPVKEPLQEGAAGHGCGHNLFGVGSLAAAIAVKELVPGAQVFACEPENFDDYGRSLAAGA